MCEENKRKEVYDFIVDFVSENLFPPSYKHIAKSLGIKSTETVSSYLQDLQMLGKIKLVKNGKMDTKIKLLNYHMVSVNKNPMDALDDFKKFLKSQNTKPETKKTLFLGALYFMKFMGYISSNKFKYLFREFNEDNK